MKHTMNNPFMQGIMLCLASSLLFSCKKESQEITSSQAPVTGDVKDITSRPITGKSPLIDAKFEEPSPLLFPGKPQATERAAFGATLGYINFDNEAALSNIPDYAAYTFATAPFYIQQVGNAWVHVKENNNVNYGPDFMSNYAHFHLSYQNFVPCLTADGKLGKPVSGGCALINPLKEPRKLDTHMGDEWIKIYAFDAKNSNRTFHLLQIEVTKGPIQLWYKNTYNEWAHFSHIPPGNWNVSNFCASLKEVLISSTNHQGPIGFDNVKLAIPQS